MRRLVALSLGLGQLCLASPGRAQNAPDREAIVAAVARHFAGMKARDTAMMASVSHPGATTAAASYREGRVTIRGGETAAGRARFAAMAEGPNEWLLASEVWQDGDLATVWAPYEIHLGTTIVEEPCEPFAVLDDGGRDGACRPGVMGTYLHGALENPDVCAELFGVPAPASAPRSEHYSRLADWFERHGRGLSRLGLT